MFHRRALIAHFAAAAVCLATPAFAQQAATENLEITGGFARATPSLAKVGIAFMTIRSLAEADRLVGYSTAACNRPEIHTHIENDGVMQMRQVDAVDVPAGGVAELKPGGFHLMMIDLNGQLVEGETLDLTLMFEKAGEVALQVPILAAGAMGPEMDGMDGGMDGMAHDMDSESGDGM